jgi:hypothetical protein
MVRLGEPVFDVVRLADHVEAHLTQPDGFCGCVAACRIECHCQSGSCGSGTAPLSAGGQGTPTPSPVSLVDKLADREFTRAVNADEQVEFAFGGLNLDDIHVKEADRVAPKALSLRPFDFAQQPYCRSSRIGMP